MANPAPLIYCPPLRHRPIVPEPRVTLKKRVSEASVWITFMANLALSIGCAFPKEMAQDSPEGGFQRSVSRGVDARLLGQGSLERTAR